jgi:GT2 family glycosyltransferase
VTGPPSGREAVPAGLRVRPDEGTRLRGQVLAGGSPTRVLRLTGHGARQVGAWLAGQPVGEGAASRKLARRLLDAGIAHPDLGVAWPGAPVPADVTVVIPVKDRPAELARCLGGLGPAGLCPGGSGLDGLSLGAVSLDGLITATSAEARIREVIVVDDCSDDPAGIEAAAAAAGARVIRRAVNGGPGAARNTGLAAARTELVAFLDSDCVPSPGWLDAVLPHFADPATGAVAPRIVPAGLVGEKAAKSWLARYEGASSTLDMGARPSIVRPGARVPYVPGATLVVRREAAGAGFSPGMPVGEDVDFVWRLAASGWRVRYEPAARMGHQHRVRLRAWFSRRSDYGTSAAILEGRHPGSVRPLYASWWTVAAWAAAVAVRPRWASIAAAAVTSGLATGLLARKLSRITGEGWPLPGRPAASGGIPGRTGDRGHSAGAGPGWTAWRLAIRLAGGGTLASGRPLGSAISRTWWPVVIPLAVVVPRLRLPVAALVLAPPLLDWADRRPPLDPARYAGARLLDDVAYSTGVWRGCLRRRSFRALLPVIGARPPAGG